MNNAEGERKRRQAAEAAVADMLKWFTTGGIVGILDATNSTKERRKWVMDTCAAHGVEVLFVESKCDDEELIMANIRDVKTTSPDYRGQDPEEAAQDFRNRIKMYEKIYKTIDDDGDEDQYTYLKLMDVSKQVIINRIQDYLQSRIVYYLMNLHIRPRSIWLSRVRFQLSISDHSPCQKWQQTHLGTSQKMLTSFSSTVNLSTILMEELAATHYFPSEAMPMRRSCPSSSGNPSE